MNSFCEQGKHVFGLSHVPGFFQCAYCPAKAEKRDGKMLVARARYVEAQQRQTQTMRAKPKHLIKKG